MKRMQFHEKLGISLAIIFGVIMGIGELITYNSILVAVWVLIMGSIISIVPMIIIILSIKGLIGEICKHN